MSSGILSLLDNVEMPARAGVTSSWHSTFSASKLLASWTFAAWNSSLMSSRMSVMGTIQRHPKESVATRAPKTGNDSVRESPITHDPDDPSGKSACCQY
jgi:hypothetical protein